MLRTIIRGTMKPLYAGLTGTGEEVFLNTFEAIQPAINSVYLPAQYMGAFTFNGACWCHADGV